MSKSYAAIGKPSTPGSLFNVVVLECENGSVVRESFSAACYSYQMQGSTIIIDDSTVFDCETGAELFRL